MNRSIRKEHVLLRNWMLVTCIAGAIAVPSISRLFAYQGSAVMPSPDNPNNEVKAVQFTVHPARIPYVALKYRLMPGGIETTPGNAAPNYFRAAMVWMSDPKYQTVVEANDSAPNPKLSQWLELDLAQLAKNDEAQRFFNGCPTGHWDLIRLAAQRERCDWDLPVREMNIGTMIPELQKLRDLSRLLAFKARVEISRKQYGSAIETIKTGLAMGRHASLAPTLVNALVGVAITRQMLDQIGDMIQQSDCPNLYWTLSALPDPVVDLRPGLCFESDFIYLFLPELRDVRTAVHTEAEWDKLLFSVAEKLIKVLPEVADRPKDLSWYGTAGLFAVTAYPKAKAQLAAAGYTAAAIKAMPISKAILLAEVETYEHWQSESLKWFFVDSARSLSGMANLQRDFDNFAKSKQEIIPLVSLLQPALIRVKSREVEADRQLAALRLVEAIRLYAVENDGKLPSTFDDIKGVPVPNDPLTGKWFAYELKNDVAIVTSTNPPGQPVAEGLKWEIRISAKK